MTNNNQSEIIDRVRSLEDGIRKVIKAIKAIGTNCRDSDLKCLDILERALNEDDHHVPTPMINRTSSSCESSPGGPYIVAVRFASLSDAQEVHAWLVNLNPPNAQDQTAGEFPVREA
jgi:hypothetical protein